MGVHDAIRRACGEGLITNNALKTPLNIPFRNFRWSELQPLSVDSLQVAVYERMPPNVRSSEPVSSTDQLLPQVAVDQTVVKGPRGQTIGTLQRDGRTVVDSEDRVVGEWNADGALMATPLSGIHVEDVVAADSAAFIVGPDGESIGALHPDGNTVVDPLGNPLGVRNGDGSIAAPATIVKIAKKDTPESVEAALRELCMFNVGSDMILELKGGCAIVDRPQCGLHMARGHADLFRFIQDVITKADAAPDFNAAYRTHMDDGRLELFVTQLINAVTFLHQQEIYHLDLKPENVIINERGDFLQLIDSDCTLRPLVGLGTSRSQEGRGLYREFVKPKQPIFWLAGYVPDRACLRPKLYSGRDQWAWGAIYVCAYGRMLRVADRGRARYDR